MQLRNLQVAALVANGFEEVEFTEPRNALRDAGATVHLVSPQAGSVRAWDGDDWGSECPVDVELNQAVASAYDALLLPGGVLSPDSLRINESALSFVRHFFASDKPVAVICHGGQTLISAGLVEGRTMTGYVAVRPDLANAGALVKDEEVVVDGRLVSSRNPDDVPAFCKKMVEVFAGSSVAAE
ncbi:type 1 glutamine amidotransferase domain-containing protein [Lewinella sp. JB7]|uniref:type 1 glutamine amidotransferase domain-containing protein n=1 Tax=Lewinella sp. JB7 TaxID=2962887 RepID=UPI0020C95FE0|nr:type 1 glutamine amidotransferase domain-containing protein [Lewinella sp. JB7]MCP9236402.1 type 1 glutamine amidotransferase [Lewinella sp. JB7]